MSIFMTVSPSSFFFLGILAVDYDGEGGGAPRLRARQGLSDRSGAAAHSPLKTVHRTVFRALRIPGPFGIALFLYVDGQSNLDKEPCNLRAYHQRDGPEGFQRAIGKPFGA
ncbi:MAG: hypothetical protein IJK29_11435, partial [Bacteroidales bacterium]|nr:hypothetical protein [Bacteroidales bacterium]